MHISFIIMAKQNFYPELKRLFAEVKVGKPPRYTPEELYKEFEAYIADLQKNPIVTETSIKQKEGNGSTRAKEVNAKYPAPPRLSDFLFRWLGVDWAWWTEKSSVKCRRREEYAKVKAYIKEYCEGVMLTGAMCGMYKENLVARYLGLAEHTENAVSQNTRMRIEARYNLEDVPDELLFRLADAMQDKLPAKTRE